jgi:hypothetical protein
MSVLTLFGAEGPVNMKMDVLTLVVVAMLIPMYFALDVVQLNQELARRYRACWS